MTKVTKALYCSNLRVPKTILCLAARITYIHIVEVSPDAFFVATMVTMQLCFNYITRHGSARI